MRSYVLRKWNRKVVKAIPNSIPVEQALEEVCKADCKVIKQLAKI